MAWGDTGAAVLGLMGDTAPSDGSHAPGTGNLSAMARWLVAHADAKAVPRTAACG
jgi:hypothetical protein